jgi:hypothetical protein
MNEALRKTHAVEWQGKERLAQVFTAACGIAVSSGILAGLIYMLLALSSMAMLRPAFSKRAPVGAGVRLQPGIEKDSVEGDLMSALEFYEKIATHKSTCSPAVQPRAQATLSTIHGYWRNSSLPPRNDLPLVIVGLVMSP